MPPGEQFKVLEGPQCVSGTAWYKVLWQGVTGWTIESGEGEYYLELVNQLPPQPGAIQCPGFLPSMVQAGKKARILPIGQGGNVLNAVAGKLSETSDNHRLATIPEGATIQVLSGPQCINGLPWWQVQYGDKIGWTPEGEGTTYWMAPID